MKQSMKKAFRFVAALLPIMIAGSIFACIYSFDTYTEDMKNELISQIGSYRLLLLVGTLQNVIYASVAGFAGYILAEKTGLMKSFRFEKNKLVRVSLVTVISGILFSLDYWTFGRILPEIAEFYESGITISNLMASVLYGGITEEILMRLFLMSLFAFVIWKLFYRGIPKEKIPCGVFIVANILAALLFAAGHLPATIGMFGELTAGVLIRCFLFNGGFGIVFGRMYRRYGIQYAMLSHMGCHIVSKLIWILFT